MLRIRLSRGGKTHQPSYKIVVIEKSNKRDGKFIEKIGYYQPTLKDSDPFRMSINQESFNKWVSLGAQPSEKVVYLAHKLGIIENRIIINRPNKSSPKKKAQERAKKKESETM